MTNTDGADAIVRKFVESLELHESFQAIEDANVRTVLSELARGMTLLCDTILTLLADSDEPSGS